MKRKSLSFHGFVAKLLRALSVELHQPQRLCEHRNILTLLAGAATIVMLRLAAPSGPGDEGEAVVMVMMPDED
jgi:hypothetical protein